ncbi:MAG: hypothetical protein L0H93_02500 [Nocardioides sp.]|nr:hypothetical protein [Nocardioides sp.]
MLTLALVAVVVFAGFAVTTWSRGDHEVIVIATGLLTITLFAVAAALMINDLAIAVIASHLDTGRN